jgi:hypothetical protein
MEKHYNGFVNTLKLFVVNLGTFCPDYDGVHKFINVFEKLDMAKVVARYNAVTHKNIAKLTNQDDSLFSGKEFNVFPGINLLKCWSNMSDEQKNILWTQLQSMYISSSFVMETGTGVEMTNEKKQCVETLRLRLLSKMTKINELPIEVTESTKVNEVTNTTGTTNNLDFNPYEGVGTDGEFGVDELMSGPKSLPGETPSGGGGGFSSFLNMGNMFNVEELSAQLKKISKDDIEEATDSIKKLLGDEVDEGTSDMLTELLTNITSELQSDKIKEGDPIKNIIGIANSVAEKMGPQIKKQNIDITKLMSTTKNLATKCKDNNGNNVFEKNDPFLMMGQMFENQMKMHDDMRNGKQSVNDVNKNPEECLDDCKQMFANMGLDGVNENDLKNLNIDEIMKNLMHPPSKQNNASR